MPVKPVETIEPDTAETISSVLNKINKIDYKTFSAKAEVDYSENSNNNSFDAKINMYKDSMIWVSITGPLGIEVARALITKDSVKVMNKLNRDYIIRRIDYLQNQLGLPLSLSALQDLLVGNAIFIDKNNSSYTRQGNELSVTSQAKDFKNFLTVLLPYYLPTLSRLEDADASRNISANLKYGDYKNSDNINFSTARNIQVNYKSKIEIKLNYKSYSFNNEISTPFSVPDRYTIK